MHKDEIIDIVDTEGRVVGTLSREEAEAENHLTQNAWSFCSGQKEGYGCSCAQKPNSIFLAGGIYQRVADCIVVRRQKKLHDVKCWKRRGLMCRLPT